MYRASERFRSADRYRIKHKDKHIVLTDKEYLFEQSENVTNVIDDYEKKETLAAVMKIINTELSDKERKIILDSFFSGKTDTVLAEESGMSTSLFSYHKRKALAKIKAIFDKNN